MRHEQLRHEDTFDLVDVAAIWPVGAGPSAPLAEVEDALARPSAAVPDMPAAAGKALVAVYGALIGAFALTMASGGGATFAIAISAFYVAVFLAVPALFLKIDAAGRAQPGLSEFLANGMDTATGHISGRGALTQMLVVPLLLTFAILAIGTVALVTL
jgi:hypothetical protein